MKRVFISYANDDAEFCEALVTHLEVLCRKGIITEWHRGKVAAGEDWQGAIDRELDGADIVVLLVSASFLASKSCQESQLVPALNRLAARNVSIVPVIVRACAWEASALGNLKAFPANGKPVATWPHKDGAWAEVTRTIHAAASGLPGWRPTQPYQESSLDYVEIVTDLAAILDEYRGRLIEQRIEQRVRVAEYLNAIAACIDGVIDLSAGCDGGSFEMIKERVLGVFGRSDRLVRLRRLCAELDVYERSLVRIVADDMRMEDLAHSLRLLRVSAEAPGVFVRGMLLEVSTIWHGMKMDRGEVRRAHEQLASAVGQLRALANGLRVR